jgi:hypothetical protein
MKVDIELIAIPVYLLMFFLLSKYVDNLLKGFDKVDQESKDKI